MKPFKLILKNFIFLLIIFSCISFAGCSKKDPIVENSVEAMTICELEQIDGINEMSDETVKALAVVIRTNIKSEDIGNFAYVPNNQRIAKLVSDTNGQTLMIAESSNYFNNDNISSPEFISTLSSENIKSHQKRLTSKIQYLKDLDSDTWEVKIKKHEILTYLKNNNISLSNISKLEPVYTDDGLLKSIKLANKEIQYETLEKEFGLKSNKITSIEKNLTNIVIKGEYVNTFDINFSEHLSAEGFTFDKILESTLKNHKLSQ